MLESEHLFLCRMLGHGTQYDTQWTWTWAKRYHDGFNCWEERYAEKLRADGVSAWSDITFWVGVACQLAKEAVILKTEEKDVKTRWRHLRSRAPEPSKAQVAWLTLFGFLSRPAASTRELHGQALAKAWLRSAWTSTLRGGLPHLLPLRYNGLHLPVLPRSSLHCQIALRT